MVAKHAITGAFAGHALAAWFNYTLENMDQAKGKTVGDAYRRTRASADTLAQANGRALGPLSYASVDTFENPRPHPPKNSLPRMSR